MDDTLYLGELVEPLGFDSIWATEHYGSAIRCSRIRFSTSRTGGTHQARRCGTAVIVAPWWNPVRLASEISMLDILLKGRRLHLGIGAASLPRVRLARVSDRRIARVLLRCDRSSQGVRWSGALHLRRQGRACGRIVVGGHLVDLAVEGEALRSSDA